MTDAFTTRPQITLATALRLVEAAVAHGDSANLPVAVAVSDAAGNLVASARMDDAPLGAMRLAADKAYTSALWQMPSGDLHESSQPGGGDWGVTSTEGGRIVVYAGGLPIFAEWHPRWSTGRQRRHRRPGRPVRQRGSRRSALRGVTKQLIEFRERWPARVLETQMHQSVAVHPPQPMRRQAGPRQGLSGSRRAKCLGAA